MKLPKLDARGFAHHFLLAVIVVGVAVGGTYYLIASHADTCDGMSDPTSSVSGDTTADSSATSEPDSSPVCGPDSGPVTAPVSAPDPVITTASCVINGVPSNPAYQQVISPTVTVTNTGNQTIQPTLIESLDISTKSVTVTTPLIQPGDSATLPLPVYTTQYNTSSAASYFINYTVQTPASAPNFVCTSSAILPNKPAPVTHYTYTASCTITNIPSTIKTGTYITPKVTIKNTGTGSIDPGSVEQWLSDSLINIPYGNGALYTKDPTYITKFNAIPVGKSITVTLKPYLMASPYNVSGSLNADLDIVGATKDFGCQTPIRIAVPAINSVTINPTDWLTRQGVVITTAKGHGNVAQIINSRGAYVSSSYSRGNSYRPLAKLQTYLLADAGRYAEVCVTAQPTGKQYTKQIRADALVNANYLLPDNTRFTFRSKGYTTVCHNTKLPSYSNAYSVNLNLQDQYDGGYNGLNLDTVTIKLR